MVEYYYDAWGNHKVVDADGDEITDQNNIGNLNPFRYRGYYYDTETGLYFLQTRYYDPEVGRFLNRDSVEYADPETINGLNLYAYCLNNPVGYADPTGSFPILGFILGIMAIGGLITTACGVATGNNVATAVGLSLITIPALISGGLAVSLLTSFGVKMGLTTIALGLGTALFASAEIQQASGNGNWLLDSGFFNENSYNTSMLMVASLATIGVFSSYVGYTFKIAKINKIGKLIPSNHPNEGYYGIRFWDIRDSLRSLEIQHHSPHGWHFQLNSWNLIDYSVSAKKLWEIFKWLFRFF